MFRIFRAIENLTFEFPVKASSRRKRIRKFPNGSNKSRATWKFWRSTCINGEEDSDTKSAVPMQRPLNSNVGWIQTIVEYVKSIFLRATITFSLIAGFIFLSLFMKTEFPVHFILGLTAVFALALTIITSCCRTFRCVMVLSISQFGTQQSRLVLLAVVTSLLLGGPLTTFSQNIAQFGRSAHCMSIATLNQGNQIAANFNKSISDINQFVNSHLKLLKKAKEELEDQVRPFRDTLTTVKTQFRELGGVLKNLARDCARLIEERRVRCVLKVRNAFDRCRATDFLIQTSLKDICEIVWAGTDICHPLLKDHRPICYPVIAANVIRSEIKKVMNSVEDLLHVDYAIYTNSMYHFNKTYNATKMKDHIRATFKDFTSIFLNVSSITQILLLLTLFWIPIQSWLFLRRVKQCYKSATVGKLSRLSSYNARIRLKELVFQFLFLGIHILFALTIFGIDFACYWIQKSLLRLETMAGSVDIANAYEVGVNVSLGDGLLFNPLTTFQFDFLKSFQYEFSNNYTFHASARDCFPTPVESSNNWYLIGVLLIYSAILILIICGNQLLKYRLPIIDYMLPELKRKRDDEKSIPVPFVPLSPESDERQQDKNLNKSPAIPTI